MIIFLGTKGFSSSSLFAFCKCVVLYCYKVYVSDVLCASSYFTASVVMSNLHNCLAVIQCFVLRSFLLLSEGISGRTWRQG